VGVPAHPRLRALLSALGADARERRLWLPPALPYVHVTARAVDDPPSKTLVFTSWGAAPPAIATALNVLVEGRPGRSKDLEPSRRNSRTQRTEPVRSVYLLSPPLWRFADVADPYAVVQRAGSPLPADHLLRGVRRQLTDARVVQVAQDRSTASVVDVALGLNAKDWRRPTPQQRAYLDPARQLMTCIDLLDSALVTKADADLPAELAAAAPGTCAYRALRRAVPGAAQADQSDLLEAAFAIGNSITRLFQRPAAAVVVENGRSRTPPAYWRQVLRYCCLDNDLQSVLDEYVFLLASDSPAGLLSVRLTPVEWNHAAGCGLIGEGELVLDGGELAQGALTAPAVVSVLAPEHDGCAELVAGAPAAAVQDVLVQQCVPGLHGGVVAGGGDPAHGALQPRSAQDGPERSRSELRPAVECTTTTPVGRRRATAVRSAVTASWAVIRSSSA
jgi:hypothetical protein